VKKLSLVILAGGKGTRLKSITTKPKPLFEFNKIPFLQHQLNHFSKYNFTEIIILVGYKSNFFFKYKDNIINSIKIKIVKEKKPLGTGGAIYNLKNIIKNDFIVVNGDTHFPININDFVIDRKNSLAFIALVKNINYKSNTSLINLSLNKKKIIYHKKSNLMNAGIYYFKKEIFKYLYKGSYSLEKKIFPKLIFEKKLSGKKYNNFFIDIGTPSNLKFFKRNSKKILFKKSAFLDRDGVINFDYGYVNQLADFKLRPGVLQGLRYLIKKKYNIFIVTNQAGIAKKKIFIKEYLKFNQQLKKFFSNKKVFFDAVEFCPHHPNALVKKYKKKCNCRKPRNGMIEKIIKNFCCTRKSSFFIGDKNSDMLAAKSSKIKFFHPEKNFLQQIKKIAV